MKRMVAALLLLLLCACTVQLADVAPAPEPPAGTSEIAPAAPEPDPLPDEVPEPEPLPDEAPEPVPEPYPFTEGPALSVNGAGAGAIALLEQAYYLPLEALTAHLPIQTEPTDDGGLALHLHGR